MTSERPTRGTAAREFAEAARHRLVRVGRRQGRRAARRRRWVAGHVRGAAYRLRGGHPAYDVSDLVLADRVRAELGKELKAHHLRDVGLDVWRHVVYLRGHVPTHSDARLVEDRVLKVSGIDGVESYLDIGVPSTGEAEQVILLPSDALQRMLAEARRQGWRVPQDLSAVRAVLATFAERIPHTELAHVWSHLPHDLRGLMQPPARLGSTPRRIRHLDDFYEVIAIAAGTDRSKAERLTVAVLHELWQLVPDEAAHIQAVLPRELKQMWGLAGAAEIGP